MDTSSPHVFVPPADTKERKKSVVLSNSRRASAVSVAPATPSLQSTIPILNEPGMQPLLPLIETDSASPGKSESEHKDEVEVKLVQEQENATERKSPETLTAKTVAHVSVVELTEYDLKHLSSIFFFLRDHPDIFLDLARYCTSLSVLLLFSRLLIFYRNFLN